MRTTILILLCLLAPAWAQDGATGAAPADSAQRDARVAMLSSTSFPALGQLYTGGKLRTISVFALETWCLSNILRESMQEDLYRRRASTLAEEGSWEGISREDLITLAEAHQDRKKDFIWRLMPVMIYSLLDAYVSAHLFNFDTDDLRGPRAALLPVFEGGDTVGLQLRVSF